MVEMQPPPNFHAAAPASSPRKGPSISFSLPSSEALRGVNVYPPFSDIQLVTLMVSANSIELDSTPWIAAAWRRFGLRRLQAVPALNARCRA